MNWKYFVHPGGKPYYVRDKELTRLSYLVELDLSDGATLGEVELFVMKTERKANAIYNGHNFPSDVEVVLEMQDEKWAYYMIDVDGKKLFWLDDFNATRLTLGHGIENIQHLRTQKS